MTEDSIFRQVFAWLKVAAPTLVSNAPDLLTPNQIRRGPCAGANRPAKPYVLVTFDTFDEADGTDEDVAGVAGGLKYGDPGFDAAAPTRTRKGGRLARFTVEAFGAGASDLCRRFVLKLGSDTATDAIAAIATADGMPQIDVDEDPNDRKTRNRSATIDTSTEGRFARSFVAYYREAGEPDTLVAVASVRADVDLVRTDVVPPAAVPDPAPLTVIVDLLDPTP